ncbi:Glycerol-3-phosphate 2-O-acyltransferase 4 [Hibiscus syriacus]|uniref:Glycerol-3-phosphate 2-O-acyltransferase 4 n=1 Tax=Hibiscus syriacus TaxID=106335 RepID=A0A6A3A941_HIBSY|nr:Glycerol-3-phosphate 2-O-acyltransferase 4 [Hibiscus syriacus]
MDGTLLRGRSSFLYFAFVAFEVGGVFRLLFLLLASPIAGILYYFISEPAGIRVLIFTSFVGLKVSDIETVARAVLPKFYSSDLHPEAWRVFSSCGKRCVLTANPRVMVEPFLKDFLGADTVIGTEIDVFKGRATGLVKNPGILVGENKDDAPVNAFNDEPMPNIALGDPKSDYPFMRLCKESYVVPAKPEVKPVPILLSTALGRPVAAVTYSVSRLSEIISPIKTARLSRDHAADASMMKKILHEGDLVICPEGTTCREPILLRFSAFFVELTDELVPVAMSNKMSMFHGTTARGWKRMDPFYFFMNPSQAYEITFLNKLPHDLTCSGGKSSHEVANYIQRMIAASL